MMGYAPSEGKLFSTERVVLLSSIYKRKATQKRIMIGTIIAIVIMYFALDWHFCFLGYIGMSGH